MKNILVIEDSITINNVIKKELSKQGFVISQAFTLAQARELLATKKFHLIILDLHLPDGEGSQLITDIQSLTKTKVVVLTSSQDASLRDELFQYGILDYIIKDKNLLSSIAEILHIINTISTKKKGNILIINNSEPLFKQVKTILEPRNYSLTTDDGPCKIKKENFDLIILDMDLPNIDGKKIIELIRKNIAFESVPILVLSTTLTPEIIRNILKSGANDFLKKPFIFEEFVLKVDLWIDYFQKVQELSEKKNKLEYVNKNLEKLVYEEVEKNRQKDKVMFSQARQAQMGEMIAMIAHQWRQPLNNLSLINQLLVSKYKKNKLDDEVMEYFKLTSKKQITLMSNTINDFRNFFKSEKSKCNFCVNHSIRNILDITKAIYTNNEIKINFNSQKDFKINGYSNAFAQAILNIINNAKDALVENKIKNKNITIDIQNDNENIIISIEDNAGGITQDIIENIFDPYFSTKEQKNGTGLGLYMSKMIIQEQMGGKLDVSNGVDGATFKITLEGEICQRGK